MSVTIGADANYVNHGSDSSLDDITAGTIMFWFYPTVSGASNLALAGKMNSGASAGWAVYQDANQTGSIGFTLRRATTHLFIVTDDVISANNWYFIAFVYDTSGADGAQHCYLGTLTSLATEQSYYSQSAGSGTPTTDAAENYYICNIPAISYWAASTAIWYHTTTKHTLGQIQSFQFHPRLMDGNCRLFSNYFGDTTLQDLSGTGNNGSESGAVNTVAHVPIRLFPFQTWMPYAVSAAVGRTTKNTDPYGLGIAPGISRTFKIGGL